MVRREIQKALAEEHAEHGTTQASIASALDVNRSVIHRQIMGYENLTLGRVGEIADVLGRQITFTLVKPERAGGNHPIAQPAASSAAPLYGDKVAVPTATTTARDSAITT
jgi:hypothetical protein